MGMPKAYDPQYGYTHQLLLLSPGEREYEHLDYAEDKADLKELLKNYRGIYMPGYVIKTIRLPQKYRPTFVRRFPLRYITVDTAYTLVPEEKVRAAYKSKGTQDDTCIFKSSDDRLVVLFAENPGVGYAGVRVIGNDEKDDWDFFSQNTDELKGWKNEWDSKIKTAYLLQWME